MNFDSNYGELNSREKVGWNELTYLEGMVEFFFFRICEYLFEKLSPSYSIKTKCTNIDDVKSQRPEQL